MSNSSATQKPNRRSDMPAPTVRHTWKTFSLSLIAASCLMATCLPASASLLEENFERVTGTTNPRSVADILTKDPTQLAGGVVWNSSDENGNSDPDVANVRQSGDDINTHQSPVGFGNFFTSQFLVLGDRKGLIGSPGDGEFVNFAIPFDVPTGASKIAVSFDWAFDGHSTDADNDVFSSLVITQDGATTHGLFDKHSADFGHGTYKGMLTLQDPGTYYLAFQLNNPHNEIAVGIDNVRVSAVPVPGAVWLLGSSLVGLAVIAQRGSAKSDQRKYRPSAG